MFRYQADGFGDVAEIGSAIGTKLGYVLGGADRFLDDGAFSGGKVKGQTHDLKRKQQIGEDNGGVDAKNARGAERILARAGGRMGSHTPHHRGGQRQPKRDLK